MTASSRRVDRVALGTERDVEEDPVRGVDGPSSVAARVHVTVVAGVAASITGARRPRAGAPREEGVAR